METCFQCGFTADRSEFIGAALDGDALVLVHRDDAPACGVLLCNGCAAALGREDSSVVRLALMQLLARAS